MTIDAPVENCFLHAETLAGAVNVDAIRVGNRLIGTVNNVRVLLVDQTNVAKHITIECENGCEAVWHSVVDPPHRSPETIGLDSRVKFFREIGHES